MKTWYFWYEKVGPLAAVLSYLIVLRFLDGLRGEHLQVGLIVLLLSYWGVRSRNLLRFLLPVILTGIVYDSMRYYSDFIRGPIRVAEPYLFDRYFFGVKTQQGLLTPNEFFQNQLHPILDFITGLAYLVFIAVFILCALIFFYWYPFLIENQKLKKTTQFFGTISDLRKVGLAKMWAFFWLNILGYSTYYWYPAAPPWYVALYGLGPAKLDVPANPAGCVRFDALLGTHFFSSMYGRSADVFGAIPSLHVAYPLLTVFFAWKLKRLRTFSICFYLLMCFSAVYLNHHYILDILWGSAYALLIAWLCTRKISFPWFAVLKPGPILKK